MKPHRDRRALRVTDVSELYSERGGGVRTYVREKLERASLEGVDLTVIVPAKSAGIDRVGSGTIVRVASPPLPLDPRYRLFASRRRLHRAIVASRPDVIEVSAALMAGELVARFDARVPKVLVLHQDASLAIGHALFDRLVSPARLDRLAKPHFRALARLSGRFDATVVSGGWLAERLRGFGLQRIRAVPFGIDKGPLGAHRRDEALRAELLRSAGVPEGSRLLVAISRHHPEKRLFTIMEGVARADVRMRAMGRQPLGLVLFGDGPLAPLVRARAKRLPGIHIAGFVRDRDRIARALASADLFVHGSGAETYGIVLAEAIASGTPFVAPSAGGARDLARPAYSALYRAGDPAGLASAIEVMLTRDRANVAAALARAKEEVVRDGASHFSELFAFYASLARRVGDDLRGDVTRT